MIVEREHIQNILTNDPAIIYPPDGIAVYERVLRNNYVGKIFKRCYVTDVLNIVLGQICDDYDRPGGYFNITISCILRGISYDEDETIHDAKVTRIESDTLAIMNNDICIIGLKLTPSMQFVKVGDILPVVAKAGRYTPYKNKIIISAVAKKPLTPSLPPQHIIVPKRQLFTAMLNELKQAEAKLTKLPAAKVAEMTKMFYPEKETSVENIFQYEGKVIQLGLTNGITVEEVKDDATHLTGEKAVIFMQSVITYAIKRAHDIINCVEHVADNPLKKKIALLYNE